MAALVEPRIREGAVVSHDAVETVWSEFHNLPGGGLARVLARVVPSSGVGWVDMEWRRPTLGGPMRSQRERLLADWQGLPRAETARAVIKLADGWFAYCEEQTERERVVAKLAEPGHHPVDSVPSQGPVVPPPTVAEVMRAMQQVMQQQASSVKSADEEDALAQLWRAAKGQMLESAPPDGGQGRVESSLPAFTWSAAGGTPEHASNGLGYAGDYIAEPEVSR